MGGFQHPDRGYVFVVTYGRSGSTVIQALLNAIPGALIRGENNNALLGLCKSYFALVRSPDIARMRSDGTHSGPDHPWFGAEQIDTGAYCAALCAAFAQHVLRPMPDTRLSGFKEIRTLSDPEMFTAYLDFIRAGFPQARFVFNMRAAKAVARSGWWRRHDPHKVAEIVASADRVFRAYAAAHPRQSVLLRYEDYVADPAALEPLFDLIGARPSDRARDAVMSTRLTHAT